MAAPLRIRCILAILVALTSSFALSTHQLSNEAYTSILISQYGLDFLKNFLISQAISSYIPLTVPNLERVEKVPVLGNLRMALSNITIDEIDLSKSYVKTGEGGVAIIASGTTCNLSADWSYEYTTWLLPVEIRDSGSASVQVEGMEVGLTLNLEIEDNSLKLILIDHGCYVKDITINLNGGASWLYQGLLDAFQDQIRSAVENSITKKLAEGVSKLEDFLKSLPREVSVDDTSSLNVTILETPKISNFYVEFQLSGLFTPRTTDQIHGLASKAPNSIPNSILECADQNKMLGISLDEEVFNSAAALYYNAKFMEWTVEKIPEQSFLKTAGWRFIIPQLYKKYPNDDMNLNITLSSPPVANVSEGGISATVYADVVINVLDSYETIPVICISLVIGGEGIVEVKRNKIGGSMKLKEFSMVLNWSKVGNLRMNLIQPVMRTLIQTVFVPFANARLGKGFPLPIIDGFEIQNAEILFSKSSVSVCGDVSFNRLFHYAQK